MGKRSAAGLLTSVDSIFTTQEERDNAQRSYVTDLSAAEISDFPNHPFKVRMDQSMVELADSVKQYGVLVPSLVRPMPDGSYQMVSGHRRKRAAELAGLPTVPCIIRELTDDEAIIVMVDSNLQREQILPSEKAVAYKMKLEAMKRQGMRTDLTFGPLGQKSAINTRDTLATEVPDSSRQIQRYIRLTNLIPELLDMVDNSVLKEAGKLQMALRPAVELSYLSEAEQTALLEVMEGEIHTPSHGYGNIKTANCCFPAGLTVHDAEPVFKDDLLVYDGRYYLIGTGHKEFKADKTGDDDYYISSPWPLSPVS